MAFRVTYTEKNGSAGSATFPSRAVAEVYARSRKNARIEETDVACSPVTVKACPVADFDMQREATRAFHTPDAGLYVPPAVARARSEEQYAEQRAEHFADCRAAGVDMQTACEDWDFIQGRR